MTIPGWNDPNAAIFHAHLDDAADAAQDQLHARLAAVVDKVKAAPPAGLNARVIADSEKRLQDVLQRLHTHALPTPLAAQIALVLDAYEAQNAEGTARQLQTLSTSFVDESRWIVGLRRLLAA
ncbi:hypothetical protein GGF31_006335 [Allomyces arbusculus]|nr:hypothetical protein GGF31_006335 [Allomyces arbusculus]